MPPPKLAEHFAGGSIELKMGASFESAHVFVPHRS